jgi:hypothetical protein
MKYSHIDIVMNKTRQYIANHFSAILLVSLTAILFARCGGSDDERERIVSSIDEAVEVDFDELVFEDPYRKYFPVVQGEKLNIVVKVENVTDKPIRILNVLTSCGCLVVKYPKVIGANGFGNIQMEYNSNKNIGHVEFYTTVIANTEARYHEIYFETNVVPDELVVRDYETLYYLEKQEEKGGIQELVDGESNQRGYIIDETEKRRFRERE